MLVHTIIRHGVEFDDCGFSDGEDTTLKSYRSLANAEAELAKVRADQEQSNRGNGEYSYDTFSINSHKVDDDNVIFRDHAGPEVVIVED